MTPLDLPPCPAPARLRARAVCTLAPLALAATTLASTSLASPTPRRPRQDPATPTAPDAPGDATPTPEAADAPTLDDLQAQIDALRERLDETPRIGSDDPTMKIFGRIHLDYWGFPGADAGIAVFENGDPDEPPQGRYLLRRARLGVSGKIDGEMVYKMEYDFGDPDDVNFKDLYFGWKDVGNLGTLLIGNQKRPYGLDALNSSNSNVFIERPFIVDATNPDARRLGLAFYDTDADEDWNWRYGLYNMSNWTGTGEYRSNRYQPELTGRLANTAWYSHEDGGRNYGHWAVSGALAFPNDDAGASSERAVFRTRPEARSDSRWLDTGPIAGSDFYGLGGLEGVANWGPTQLCGEYMGTVVTRDTGSDLHLHGGYVYLSHFLTGEHMPWNRTTGTLGRPEPNGDSAWQVGLRYSYADFTSQDVFGGVGHAVTLGLNWYWNANANLQFNYIHGTVDDRAEDVGGTVYTDGDYDIVGLRFRIDF